MLLVLINNKNKNSKIKIKRLRKNIINIFHIQNIED